MYISYLGHTRTRHQSLFVMTNTKAHHPPETKRKASKVSHHTHGFLFKKKKKRGEDDKSKNIDDGQVPMFTLAHGQSSLMA